MTNLDASLQLSCRINILVCMPNKIELHVFVHVVRWKLFMCAMELSIKWSVLVKRSVLTNTYINP